MFVGAGMLADKRRYGRVHPAWLWGVSVAVALQVVADLVAYSPIGYRFTEWFLAGTAGAGRTLAAFLPRKERLSARAAPPISDAR